LSFILAVPFCLHTSDAEGGLPDSEKYCLNKGFFLLKDNKRLSESS
jgi:hypothetical protein